MRDINDYILFTDVVKEGSFAAASRKVKIPKSTISRRIGNLEARLGVRLVERSTRRFRVTEIGQTFYERCTTILLDVEQADSIVSESLSEPQGLVRCSCPLGLFELLSPTFSSFMLQFPKVRLQLIAGDQPVNLIEDRIDVAVRVRTVLETDASLIVRTLGHSRRILVASPSLAVKCNNADIQQLSSLPTLATVEHSGEVDWKFNHHSRGDVVVRHEPKMTCVDFATVREAAINGLGIALLPDHTCRESIESNKLVHVFPDWSADMGIVHIVFTTRRGLPPAVRLFIDHLAKSLK
jgi:DNA-binding transcriptional LysR family regulator